MNVILSMFLVFAAFSSRVTFASLASASSTLSTFTTSSSSSTTSLLPFDAKLGTNYTQPSCLSFLSSLQQNASFTSCLPFSFLLTSTSFFNIERAGAFAVSSALDKVCAVKPDKCSVVVGELEKELGVECEVDLRRGQPVAVGVQQAFEAWEVEFVTGCLKDPTTGSYCFSTAITSTSPADSYLYFLPLGSTYPGGARPTCSNCTLMIMETYESYEVQGVGTVKGVIGVGCGDTFLDEAGTGSEMGRYSVGGVGKMEVKGLWTGALAMFVGGYLWF
ncbi:hypothetical protein YB2330_001838 [Saitoella coloradoensis]